MGARRLTSLGLIVTVALTALGLAMLSAALSSAAQSSSARDVYRRWTGYGGGPEQIRYSSLSQINRTNVARLAVAWSYDTGETGGLQTQPIVVDGVLYACTPTHRTFALDAATGRPLWTFDAKIAGTGPNRGVSYWTNGSEARVFTAVDRYLYALDARTGVPAASFGTDGRIDLQANLDRDPDAQSVRLTSPGVVYRDLLIIGGRVAEALPASYGDIRAYDVRTGALRWTFHTIPRPGEFGHDTWPQDAWKQTGGANNWAGMALDERRGIVYVPTGSAATDFYGANRLGDNLFANTLIALDASTGKRLWHYQLVRHDIWDRDLPSPPSLVTLNHGGRSIDAVVQVTKHGFVFVFDRVTGKSLFPIDSQSFPGSTLPGERASRTQPVPRLPRPFARQHLTADQLTKRTPEAQKWALEQFSKVRSDGLFVPLSTERDTVMLPGFDGGPEWGGSAADPETGLYYVNANDVAWLASMAPTTGGRSAREVYLRDCAACHRDDLQGAPPAIPSLVGIGSRHTATSLEGVIRRGAGRMSGFPNLRQDAMEALVAYLRDGADLPIKEGPPTTANMAYRFTGFRRFSDPDGYPAVAPPWGTLSAINLNTGEYAWRVPLGEYPELASKGLRDTGSENYGGPIVTAGGIVFIGATNFDNKFRAFDKASGQLLWETTLPFPGTATPATYEVDGRQYVVIAAGGHRLTRGKLGGVYVAFALPAPDR